MRQVVNCFHFSVSLGYKTTPSAKKGIITLLWIAFIFQYLWDTKQLLGIISLYAYSCELLSFFSIFGIQNNKQAHDARIANVVNCFHFSVSLGYKTTEVCLLLAQSLLWIAFIFQYLWDTKQPGAVATLPISCCELLSFFSIFGIQNNANIDKENHSKVVNCFHFSVSLGYKTTASLQSLLSNLLWIAFIFQYLWDTKQQEGINAGISVSCELLSFFSIFGIQNNFNGDIVWSILVVNCFHFSVSLGYKTTILQLHLRYHLLWIAFIFQYLWDTKQLLQEKNLWDIRCELLSFFSIFGIQNNMM